MNQGTLTARSLFDKKTITLNILALLTVYLVPVFSHLTSLPVYYIEPMRLAILFSIIFANYYNSLVIAITLPIFSFFVSAHPVLAKSFLISGELLINVVLFYALVKIIKNSTVAFLLSLISAKLFYYLLKYMLLNFAILDGTLISTPMTVQLIMIAVFTTIFFIVAEKYLGKEFK